MLNLTFTRELHDSVARSLATPRFPAILKIGDLVSVLFNDASIGDYDATIDENHRDALLSHPIARANATYLARVHIMVTLVDFAEISCSIRDFQHFDDRLGWQGMFSDEAIIVRQPTTEPEWLLTKFRR